jgi:hypothetical protein
MFLRGSANFMSLSLRETKYSAAVDLPEPIYRR